MADSKRQQQSSTGQSVEEEAAKVTDSGEIPASVAGDDGQSVVRMVPESRAKGSVPPVAVAVQRYSTSEGYEAGNTAPSDLYVDDESGKVTTSQPERGTLVASKGATLTPLAARLIQDAGGSPS